MALVVPCTSPATFNSTLRKYIYTYDEIQRNIRNTHPTQYFGGEMYFSALKYKSTYRAGCGASYFTALIK